MDPVLDVAARSQHQHRHGFATGAQTRQHFEAVHARQADIEHRHGIFLTGQGQVGGHTIVQHIHGQAGTFQGLGHAFSQLQMVFDEQHTHRSFSGRVAVNGAECTADSPPVKPWKQ
ncbi:hypothetical protein D3C79_780220 [compost metagenome]